MECVFINFKIELIYLDMFENIIEYAQNMAKVNKNLKFFNQIIQFNSGITFLIQYQLIKIDHLQFLNFVEKVVHVAMHNHLDHQKQLL